MPRLSIGMILLIVMITFLIMYHGHITHPLGALASLYRRSPYTVQQPFHAFLGRFFPMGQAKDVDVFAEARNGDP